MTRLCICLFLAHTTKRAEWCTFQVALYRIALFMHPLFINNTRMPQNIRSNDSIISEYCIWKGVQRVFFYPNQLKEYLPFSFWQLSIIVIFFHHLSRLLTLSMASVRLWHLWMWSRSTSSVSPRSGHIWESIDAVTFIVAVGSHVWCWGDNWQPRHF